MRPEARAAARTAAITAGKEKKHDAESKKKAEKAKGASSAAKGIPGAKVSKQQAKGSTSKNAATRR